MAVHVNQSVMAVQDEQRLPDTWDHWQAAVCVCVCVCVCVRLRV